MLCLVTGGAGFIGSHLTEALLAKGYQVRVLDDLSTGSLDNLTDIIKQIDFLTGSIQEPEMVARAVEGASLVFHLAALVSVPASIADPQLSVRLNDLGTLNVYRAAVAAGCRRLVFSSSSAVYGGQTPPPHGEEALPAPDSPYAAHKLLGEHYGRMFWPLDGLETVALRYFNVYGPRQAPDSPYSGVISIFMDRLSRQEGATIFGDGEQTRDFVYVSDVVTANLQAAEAREAAGEVFNVGTGRTATINQVYHTLSRLAGSHCPPPSYAPARAGDVKHSAALTAKAKQGLGFEAQVTLEDGLKATWRWFSQRGA